MQDNPEERWMTFAELADARGISRESAIRLIRKKRWRRQRDNRGNVIALIPDPWADPPDRPADDPAERPAEQANNPAEPRWAINGFHTQALATLDTAVTTLREQLVRAEARADSADQRADQAEARADAAESDSRRADALIADLEGALRAKDTELAEYRVAVDQARTEAQQAQKAANGLRERAESAERDLAVARHDAGAAQQAAAELRLAEEARKARGRLRRAWDGWRGR
jgi:hypothetical protein